MRRNGVSHPEKEGNVKRVWDICSQLQEATNQPPLRETVMDAALLEGIPNGTSKSQYSNWCRYHGVDSRAVNKKVVA